MLLDCFLGVFLRKPTPVPGHTIQTREDMVVEDVLKLDVGGLWADMFSTRGLLLTLPVALLFSVVLTFLYTNIRYFVLSKRHGLDDDSKPSSPLSVPYTIPWLGHTVAFMNTTPGRFYDQIRTRITSIPSIPSTILQSCSLMLGGETMHMTWDPMTITSLFKNHSLKREKANYKVLYNLLGMSTADLACFYDATVKDQPGYIQEDDVYHAWLLEKNAVDSLAATFSGQFIMRLRRDLPERHPIEKDGSSDWIETDLYLSFLRPAMFQASTISFLGDNIFKSYPTTSRNSSQSIASEPDVFAKDFFEFDQYFIAMYMGLPRFFAPQGWDARDRLLNAFTAWGQSWLDARDSNDEVVSSEAIWEPRFGSRFMREREKIYDTRKMTARGRAGVDLGLLFGISSNAIPATGWILMEILTDPELKANVLAELQSSEAFQWTNTENPAIDIQAVLGLPWLNATYQEVLRCYTDVIVQREVPQDVVLSASHQSSAAGTGGLKDTQQSKILFKGPSMIVMPSWLAHRDPGAWPDYPADKFHPERFIIPAPTPSDPDAVAFSTSKVQPGKFFPWGGGRSICPGRVFAKQEIFAAVATFLLMCEVEVVGYVDLKGNARVRKPGLIKALPGTTIMNADGDVRVKLRRRR